MNYKKFKSVFRLKFTNSKTNHKTINQLLLKNIYKSTKSINQSAEQPSLHTNTTKYLYQTFKH